MYWTPRILSIAFILFLSVFALDVFDDPSQSFAQQILALAMHLIPSFVLTIALVLAWRWEWVGAVVYGLAGSLYVVWVAQHPERAALPMRLLWMLMIAGPAFFIAGMFLANWRRRTRRKLHES